MPERLTENFIKGLAFEGKPRAVRDSKVTGLMVAINKTAKSYKVQRDLWVGQHGRRRLAKTVRYTLGTTDDLSLEQARDMAQTVIGQIKKGIDPNAALGAGRREDPGTWTVERMYAEYAEDMRVRDCAPRSIADMQLRLDRYLPRWKRLPINEVKRSMAREEHRRISSRFGPIVANQAMRDFRACYNFAMKVVDDPDALPGNPVAAVTFNKERPRGQVLMPAELPEWWAKVQALSNPIRRDMHVLGLLSGLRPGTLVSLRREWVHLDEAAIVIPRMKSGRSFALPLSKAMVELVRETMARGDLLYPGSPWLFPTWSRKGRKVIATQVWREKAVAGQTGHILRHTYRTNAQRVGLDQTDARLLLDHAVPGIEGVYVHERALFDRLLVAQERMTAAVFELCGAGEGK